MVDLTGADPSMELAWQTAKTVGLAPALPVFLKADTLRKANARRAVFLLEVENTIEDEIKPIREGDIKRALIDGRVKTRPEYLELIVSYAPVLANRFARNRTLAEITERLLSDITDPSQRISVSLGLFAGYLNAAKIIGDGVRGRKNDANTRQEEMQSVDDRAKNDPIYRAGVQAAPFYKRAVLKQDIFRDGIPEGSIVLQDWID